MIDEAQHAKAKAMLDEQGAQTKTLLFMLFILFIYVIYTDDDPFTKTGSGQT